MTRSFLTRFRAAIQSKISASSSKKRVLRIDALEDRAVPAAPVIDPIHDQTILAVQAAIQIPVVASDSDGDPLTFSVRAAGSDAFLLATSLRLKAGTRSLNWGGAGEIWFEGQGGSYFLKPNGDLSRWDGTPRSASGTLLASLPPVYFYYPDLLTRPTNGDLASVLDRRLGLAATVSPAANSLGLGEKWFAGSGGIRFFIAPDGALYRAATVLGGPAQTLMATLDPAFYQDTLLLTQAGTHQLGISLAGSLLQVDTRNAAAGTYAVEVSATDGKDTTRTTFHVRLANVTVPVLDDLGAQVLGVGENAVSFKLSATDVDGDPLTYSVRTAGSESYFFATSLGLKPSTRPLNWGKEGERWFQSQNGWYFLKPSGDFYKWDGTLRAATGDLVTTLPPVYFYCPDLLTRPKNQDLGYVLDQRLGLSPTATPATNSLGLSEKWLKGSAKDVKFFITPDGAFYRRTEAALTWLADLSAEFYVQPARLYAASRDRFSASVTADGTVTVLTKPNFIGDFSIEVAVNDGLHTATRLVSVTQSDYVSPAPPRVIGALSTGNRTVVVSFNQPMNNLALQPSSYSISSPNPIGVSLLGVMSARFLSAEQTAVELTTQSQSEVAYVVAVANVKDLGGATLASPMIINGVVVDPTRSPFTGSPPDFADLVDTDKDGLNDGDEQRGWPVSVTALGTAVSTRWVTSNPNQKDSDGDGLFDYDEFKLNLDPRNADTDRDQLTDYQEYNEIYSDATKVDTDGDSLDDSLEYNFFRSNPSDKDTDGDQIEDSAESLLGNRNLRSADVPKPGIEIGATNLALDVRFTATSVRGTTKTELKSVQSTLSQTDTQSFSDTDSHSDEFATKVTAEQGWKVQASPFAGAEGKVTVEAGYTGQWSSSVTKESAKETQKAASNSFQTGLDITQQDTVQREVAGARMSVGVSLKIRSNLAFTIKNVQLTAFIQDPRQVGRLIPIATLKPDTEPPEGFTLGPLVPERGPFIFSNDQIFPSLVQDLMINPSGLVFKISNYDIVDERGRNFAFSSQDINDRTAPLSIDFGFGDAVIGATERYRVSTASGRVVVDTNGDGDVDANDRRISFDPITGRAVGITIDDAMQNILGLTKYNEAVTPSAGLTLSQRLSSYSTKIVPVDTDSDPGTPSVPVETLWRVRDVITQLNDSDPDSPILKWIVFDSNGIDGATNFSDLVLKPEDGVTFKFAQDLDNDGILASQEYILGSSDSNLKKDPLAPKSHVNQLGYDTDGDGLSDAFEFYGGPLPQAASTGWNVQVAGKETSYRASSSPARADSDLDGLTDAEEYNFGNFTYLDGTTKALPPLDPSNPDTDGDGISDFVELNGYDVTLRFPEAGLTKIRVKSDPLNPDFDGDTLNDGAEQTLGTNPTKSDGDKVKDDDADGLVNFSETQGWQVTVQGVSTTPKSDGAQTVYAVTSKSDDKDSDDDGLSDQEEFDLKTDPRKADTDGDGLDDIAELNAPTINADGTRKFTELYDPLDADWDNDKRSDGAEVKTSLEVKLEGKEHQFIFSDPKVADADGDGLVDGDETFTYMKDGVSITTALNPKSADTDGDNAGVDDAKEIAIGTNPVREDQKIRITVVSVVMAGTVDDASGGLDLWGKIKIGREGALEDVGSYTETEVNTGYNLTLNRVYEYILSGADKIVLKTVNFFDNDNSGMDDGIADDGDDLFADATKEFPYEVPAETSVLESAGDSATGTNVKLQVNYKVEILGV